MAELEKLLCTDSKVESLKKINAIIENAGRIEETLTNKADKNELTPLKKAYITETYVNGASGYNIYSNGYCEQWGTITQNSGFTHTVTFLKRFKDTNYQVYVCSNWNSKGSSGTDYFYNKTVSGCGFVTQNVTGTANWRASGYIA